MGQTSLSCGHFHHHHHNTACGVLGPVTISGPINSPEVSSGDVLGFISHTFDIS